MIECIAAVVVVLIIVLVTTLGSPSRNPAHPAQIAAFHILKEIRALSNNKSNSSLTKSASIMGSAFPTNSIPSLGEARIIYSAFSTNIPALQMSSDVLQNSAINIVQKDGSGATADMAGWMVQAGSSIKAIIGLIGILGDELP